MTDLLAAHCGFFTRFPNSSEETSAIVAMDKTHFKQGSENIQRRQQSRLIVRMNKLLTVVKAD